MMLAICSQDIGLLEVGLVSEEGEMREVQAFEVPPEQHLSQIARFLEQANLKSTDLSALFIVSGPGSFTASRVSTTIANAMAFVRELPMYVVENPEKKSLAQLLKSWDNTQHHAQEHVDPSYDRPPTITTPKKT